MTKTLSDYNVLTFDCYGTLIDWQTGIWDALQPLIRRSSRDDITHADAVAAFGALETRQQSATPDMLYPELLTHVHRAIADRLGVETDAELDAAFGASVPHWPAFADTADALRRLKQHYKLVILSNVNRDGFAASNLKLGVDFDAIYTAQDVGSYKPTPANFAYLLDHVAADLGFGKEAILHTAESLYHDHAPATDFGLARCWIDRQGVAAGGAFGVTAPVDERPEVDFYFRTMGEMAAARDAED